MPASIRSQDHMSYPRLILKIVVIAALRSEFNQMFFAAILVLITLTSKLEMTTKKDLFKNRLIYMDSGLICFKGQYCALDQNVA